VPQNRRTTNTTGCARAIRPRYPKSAPKALALPRIGDI
jgi:hypothetical protein